MSSQLNASALEKRPRRMSPAGVLDRALGGTGCGRRPVFAELAGARSGPKSPGRLFAFEGVFDTANGVLNLALYLVGLAL